MSTEVLIWLVMTVGIFYTAVWFVCNEQALVNNSEFFCTTREKGPPLAFVGPDGINKYLCHLRAFQANKCKQGRNKAILVFSGTI